MRLRGTRQRGTAMVAVLLVTVLLTGVLVALSALVQAGYRASIQHRELQGTLVGADDIAERVAQDVQLAADAALVQGNLVDGAGNDQGAAYPDFTGFVGNAAGDESLAAVTRYYDDDGGLTTETAADRAFRVDIRSAYRTWRNDDVEWVKADTADPAGPEPSLPRVSNADRASLVEEIFDYYEVTIDNTPGITQDLSTVGRTRREPRQVQLVYKMLKPHYPAAVYLDGATASVSGDAVIDGRDHAGVDVDQTHFIVPFSANIALADVPVGEAGYDSSLFYVDPVTGDPVKIFDSSQAVWHDPDVRDEALGSLLREDTDGDGDVDEDDDVVTFGADAPLDFYIYVKNTGETHHLFGHSYYDPGHPNHNKRFGYAWDVRLELRSDVDRASLGRGAYGYLQANYPDLADHIADADAFKADPTGGDGVIMLNEDLSGDGFLANEDDVNGNGLIDEWSAPPNGVDWTEQPHEREDRDDDGVRDDQDRRLAEAVQEYVLGLEDAAAGDQYAASMQLYMGFEDLPGGNGGNDWDYDDVLVVFDLIPNGDDEYLAPNPPSFERRVGIPAVVSGNAGASFAADVAYDRAEQVRTAYTVDGDGILVDVFGAAAYDAGERPVEALRDGFLASADPLAPDPWKVTAADSAAMRALVAAMNPDVTDPTRVDGPRVIHVQNAGGDPAVLDGAMQGRGVLIVEGDLEIHDNVVWRGAVIVGGRLTMSSSSDGRGAWVFGSVMVSGQGVSGDALSMSGNAHVAYSSEDLELTRELDPVLRPLAVPHVWRRLR